MKQVKKSLLVALATSLLLPFAACNDDAGDRSNPPEEIERPVAMEASWSADVDAIGSPARTPSFAPRAGGPLATWRIGSSVVIPGTNGLAAFATEDGARQWEFTLPSRLGQICGMSEKPNEDGTVALLFADDSDCDVHTIGAFDTDAGKLLWKAPLGDTEYLNDDAVPSITEKTVSMPIHCDDVRRFDVRTGKRLPNAFPDSDACLNHVEFGEGLMVVSRRSAQDGTNSLTAYDEDSMRELWSTSLEERTRITRVVSAKPLVLGVEAGGHRLFQRFDKNGHPGKYVGFESNANFPKVLGTLDGQFIASYSIGVQDSPAYAFDLASGQRTWAAPALHPAIAGRSGDDLLTLQWVVPDPEDDARGLELWVGLADPTDPTDAKEVGRIAANDTTSSASLGWSDDDLYVLRDGTLSAYALDVTGEPLPQAPDQRPTTWAEDDVTPADTLTLCDAIRPATVRALGFRTDLPRPSGCRWSESERPDDQYKYLSVEMFPMSARTADDGTELTSVEAAEQQVAKWRDEKKTNYVAPMKSVEGLSEGMGDKAWQATKGNTTRLIARKGNLIVIVHYELDARGQHKGIPRRAQQVFTDLLAGLD
ncbi:hypothetical protein ASG90_01840 [Nocardioides sp. Soil797]|nr:hypothetical protein ASG90_01840 [Nocardioides sp. Soil797]